MYDKDSGAITFVGASPLAFEVTRWATDWDVEVDVGVAPKAGRLFGVAPGEPRPVVLT